MTSVTSLGPAVPLGLHDSMPETKAVSFAGSRSEFFDNLLDIVNPLQHIPGVSTIYRAITGDEIAAPARLIGSALFGGPVGFASAAANMMLEEATGGNLASHALAFVGGLGDAPEVAAAAFMPPVPQAAIDLAAAAAPAPPPAPQAAASLAAADGGGDIIWNGPRVLPSLARAPTAQGGMAGETAAETSAIDGPASDVALANRVGARAQAADTGAAGQPPGARPAWLGAAITDAQSVQEAAQLGKAAQKVEGQPWITDAMLEALTKYETLARERNR